MTQFNRPTQVLFVDSQLHWSAGIAYKNEIICGCCGNVFPIEKIKENGSKKGTKNAIRTLYWVNITQEIFDNYVDEREE